LSEGKIVKKILTIDCTQFGKIGFALSSLTVEYFETEKQSVALAENINKFLFKNNACFNELSAIAVVTGPGSFTGIRIGIAFAKGLALGLEIPVIPINAFEIYLESDPNSFVSIPSGRGDFFCASSNLSPCVMTIVDTDKKIVGSKSYDLKKSIIIAARKLAKNSIGNAIPLYLRPHYAE
jgi:tRNA threonylcarbamoyl adenosine modification protein YeaZ